jgi:YVTN family beta-propeller protein
MSLKVRCGPRAAVLAAVVSMGLFCNGCGDYFRPVANPVFQPGGDPQRSRHAVVVSSNGANTGAAVVIDVSGDDAAAIFSGVNSNGVDTGVGRNPVYATNIGGEDYVVNLDDNSLSAFFLPIVPNPLNPPIQISLPNLTCPGVAAFAPDQPPLQLLAAAQNKLFVAESARNCVAVIDPVTNGDIAEIPVGTHPVAVVATPDGNRVYVLNKTDGSVTLIFPATNQPAPPSISPISVGAAPVWGAASSDSSRVFILNQGDSTVSLIDTISEKLVPGPPLQVGPGPNYIVYQAGQNRVYVTSPADDSLSIIENATGASPTVTVLSLAGPPCNAGFPISVTALADGSRAYVADKATSTVCVLDTTSNQFIKSITNLTSATLNGQPLPAAPVFIASDSDSTRVYTANSGSHDISIIDTSTDTTVKQSGTPPPLTSPPLTICAGPPTIDMLGNVTCPTSFVPTFIAMTP